MATHEGDAEVEVDSVEEMVAIIAMVAHLGRGEIGVVVEEGLEDHQEEEGVEDLDSSR